MRVKTTITLPKELLNRLDHVDKNRSAVLERAARAYLAQFEREARDRRDVETIDRHAGQIDAEPLCGIAEGCRNARIERRPSPSH